MEYLVIAAFSLFTTVFMGIHVLYALGIGYALFFLYGLYKKKKPLALLLASWGSTKNIGSLLFFLALISLLTASWRASGTIAFLVVNSTYIIEPSLFVLSAFILCGIVSMLTGTSFGTSATMGVICMTLGNVFNIDPAHLGGAILSGSYLGDRMSPMSSSAHLIAKVTQTDIFVNIKNMLRTCILPFIATCIVYVLIGYRDVPYEIPQSVFAVFEENFNLHFFAVIPALLIVVLTFCKVHARTTVLLSTASASLLCITLQGMAFSDLLSLYWFGFQSSDTLLNAILGGGGLASMVKVLSVVAISTSYVGLFQETEIFENMKEQIARLSARLSPFGATCCVAIVTCMMTCNQTLAILLTNSLCEKEYASREELAHAIENSAVLFAGLVPWNVACSVILSNVGAPMSSILYASLLYLIPLASLYFFRKRMP